MGDDERQGGADSPAGGVTRKAGRFSKEFIATVISLVTTALGVVVALAWNTALAELFKRWFPGNGQVVALFVYAVAITAIGVVAIVSLGKLAARIGAEPVEFKYPAKEKD